MISIIIPARNEIYLKPTIDDILTKSRGEIEVIAVLDGYWPEPVIKDEPRVTLVHHTTPIGQRHAINEAARIAKGKYILKTDAHSMFDEGFDVKLAADCEYNWTVIPRMYNMDIEKWEPKLRKVTDYMFIRSPYAKKKPFRHYYFDGPCSRETPKEYRAHRLWQRGRPEIDDVMTGQGACWFMHKDRFWELGGLDEGHGQWGQMGIEVALKAWLSGGKLKVNKKTWFSHWFRGGKGGPGCPWPMNGKEQEFARKYSQDFWLNEKWPLQKRPLSWLVNKFRPVPTWNNSQKPTNLIRVPYKETRKIKPWSQAYARMQCKGPIQKFVPATIKSLRNSNVWFVKVRWFKVKDLFENRLAYSRPNKLEGIRWQLECIPPFVKRVLDGEQFDVDKIKQLGYYKYLVSRLNPLVHPPSGPSKKGVRHCIRQVQDMIKLCYGLRDDGLRAPFDMFIYGEPVNIKGELRDKVIQIRGSRRLAIAYYLGWDKVPVRIWRTEHISERFIPPARIPTDENSFTKVAADQFAKYGKRSTDKYYRHCYTYQYDKEFADLKRLNTLKILELGVKYGASLKMWKDACPQAKVYGIDIKLSQMLGRYKDKDIHVFECDEMDSEKMVAIAKKHGPFNIIIDDCNHAPHCQQNAFDILWPHVMSQKAHNGIYVIEDLYNNYRKAWLRKKYGDKEVSVMPTLKNLVDNIYETNDVKNISFYPNIVFITKA